MAAKKNVKYLLKVIDRFVKLLSADKKSIPDIKSILWGIHFIQSLISVKLYKRL